MRLYFVLFLFIHGTAFAQVQIRNVLFLGNSYTAVNNLPQVVGDMARSTGDSLYSMNSTIGGYTLEDHLNDSNSTDLIKNGGWDFVVLQDQSQRPSFPTYDYYYGYELCNITKEYNPCARPLFYMTWGRKNGDASNCSVWPPVCTYSGMDSLLALTYLDLAGFNDAEVSPVGAVWKYIRLNHPAIELYQPDESHPSLAGTYLAACTFYTSIFKKDPTQITFNSTLSGIDADNIRQAVKLIVYDSLSVWDFGNYIPDAGFNFTIGSGMNEVNFLNISEYSDSYSWDFGDGNFSTDVNPDHNYISNGTYTITLTASNCDLDTVIQTSIQKTISFCQHSPTIFPDSLIVCPGSTDTIQTQIYDSYQWYDESGNAILNETNNYLIPVGGNFYSVETTLNGCTEMSPKVFVDGYFSINNYQVTPYANFIGTDSVCMGDTILLVISPTKPPFHDIDAYLEWFKDSVPISFSQNDSIYINSTGNYGVMLRHSICPNYYLYNNFNLNYTFVVCNPTVNENEVQAMELFPNPVRDILKLKFRENNLNETYSIVDLSGRMILSGKIIGEETLIDLNTAAQGVYFIKISGDRAGSFKFIKL
jgi:PKD repeat protein